MESSKKDRNVSLTKGIGWGLVVMLPAILISNIKLSPEDVKAYNADRAKLDSGATPSTDAPDDQASPAVPEETDTQKIADGTHCVVGWDNSVPAIKDAVKERLRDPDSFEHIETVWTRMGKDGNFLLSMKYRAHNGFGGMNVEEADAIVNATTCHFKFVPGSVLMKKLKYYSA